MTAQKQSEHINPEHPDSDSTSADQNWLRMLAFLAVLIVAWVLWSWFFKPLVVALGLVSCVLVVFVMYRMEYFKSEHYALRFSAKLPLYWLWLLKEIFRSSLEVAKIVLNPRLPISPQTLDIDTGMDDPLAQAIYANSITLTPGTLTLDVYEGVIKVHSLTKEGADDLVTGEMARRVFELKYKQ